MIIIQQIKTSIILLLLFTVLTGLIYPGLVTGLAQLLFPWEAEGSLIVKNKQILGSVLIGQNFTDPQYFHGRAALSASGLDPDISPEDAFYQVERIAKIRKMPEHTIKILIQNITQERFLGILGERRVNVLLLNLNLDKLHDK